MTHVIARTGMGVGLSEVPHAPRVYVEAIDLNGEAPIAVYDSLDTFQLGIDFSRPPEEIIAALTMTFQDAITSRRWQRNRLCTSRFTQNPPQAGTDTPAVGPR